MIPESPPAKGGVKIFFGINTGHEGNKKGAHMDDTTNQIGAENNDDMKTKGRK